MNKNDGRKKLKQKRLLKGFCVYCGTEPFLIDKNGCQNCLRKKYKIQKNYLDTRNTIVKIKRRKIRKDIIAKYGGRCKCCGESRWEFLTIDHINNDGAKERKEKYGTQSGNSMQWFLELKRLPIRDDLQVLCFNCNLAKSLFGVCPHEKEYEPIDFSILELDFRRKKQLNIGCKIRWPDDEKLIEIVNTYDCESVARAMGIHGTALRARLQRRGLYHLVIKNNGKKNNCILHDKIISAYQDALRSKHDKESFQKTDLG